MTSRSKKVVFVGFVSGTVDDVESLLVPAEPPSNYKDEDKKAEFCRNAMAKALETAPLRKGLGRLRSVAAIDPYKGMVFQHTGDDAAAMFYAWLIQRGYDPVDCVVFGINAKEFLRVSGTQLLQEGFQVPLGYWYQHEGVFDPADMLIESESRKTVNTEEMLRRYSALVPPRWQPNQNAMNDVSLAYQLTLRCGLLPVECVETAMDVQRAIELQEPVLSPEEAAAEQGDPQEAEETAADLAAAAAAG